MKQKLIFALIVVTILIAIPKGYSQNVVITLNDGSTTNNPLSSVKDLTFSTDEMFLETTASVKSSYQLSNIRKVTFSELVAVNNTTANKGTFYVYPNPVAEEMHIGNLGTENVNIRIYRLDGTLVKQQKVSDESAIDVGNLMKGIYMIQANTSTLKFIKL